MENQKVKFSVAIRNEGYQKLINETLGDKEVARRFVANISTAVASNSLLSECTPASILSAGLQAETLNLPINSNLGFAYLIPYNKSTKVDGKWVKQKVCQFQLGYKGIIQLAIRSGQYETLGARVVHKGEYEGQDMFGEDTFKFNHDYDNEEVVGYFAYIKLVNGFTKTFYMTKDQMENHADRYSQAYRSDKENKTEASKRTTDFDAMGLKTVLKLLISKFGVMSVDMQNAFKLDQSEVKANGEPDYIDNVEEVATEVKSQVEDNLPPMEDTIKDDALEFLAKSGKLKDTGEIE